MAEATGERISVLLATDGSKPAVAAEQWLTEARWRRPPLIDVVCVARGGPSRLGWTLEVPPAVLEAAAAAIRDSELMAAQRIANEVGSRLQAAGLAVRTWVREGNVVEGLLQMAAELQCDCIVVGPRGRSPVLEILLGSVTLRLVEESSWPVLVARPATLRPPGRSRPHDVAVLVESPAAAERALAILADFGWLSVDRLSLVALLEPLWDLRDDPVAIQELIDEVRTPIERSLDRLVRRHLSEAQLPVIEMHTAPRSGEALKTLDDLGAELAVVTRGDRTGLPKDHLAAKIARYAHSSVLVVPPTDAAWGAHED